MKKKFVAMLSAFGAMLAIGTSAVQTVLPESASEAANTMTQAAIREDTAVPGLNAFTGDASVLTFDTDADLAFVSATPKWSPGSAVDAAIVNSNKIGLSFGVRNTNGVTDASGHFVTRVTLNTAKTVDRPSYLIFRVSDACTHWVIEDKQERANLADDWRSGIVHHSYTKTLNTSSFPIDLWSIYSNKYWMYMDNVALIPYYKITFKTVYPDSTTGEDVVVYDLDTANIDVSDSGVIGLPTAYTVDTSMKLQCDGYSFHGWSTDESADTPMTTVPLANEDITLYPVFVEATGEDPEENPDDPLLPAGAPGMNVLTGTDAVITFDSDDDLSHFVIAPRWDSSAVVSYGIGTHARVGTGLKFANTNGVTDASGHFVTSVVVKSPVELDRPSFLMSTIFDACTNWRIENTQVASNLASDWKFGSIRYTYTKTLNTTNYPIEVWSIYSNKYDMYMDNVALIPYYKITYKTVYPNGTTGEDVVVYDLDTTNIGSSGGVLSGMPTAYTVDTTKTLKYDGYFFSGWSTEEDADTPMTTVPLANEDITLYPVFSDSYDPDDEPLPAGAPGMNVLTGSDSVITFDSDDDLSHFVIIPKWDSSAVVTSGIGTHPRVGTGLKFANTNGVTDASGHFVTYVIIKSPVTFDRPVFLLSTIFDARTNWLVENTQIASNLADDWRFGTLRYTYTKTMNTTNYPIDVWSIYSNKYDMYMDNVALIPYYKITYKTVYPDGTTGEDVVVYDLDTTNIGSSAGVLTGLPTAYTADKTLEFDGYTLLGWSTDENAEEPMTTVPLENEDITLYPVFKKTISYTVTLSDGEESRDFVIDENQSFILPTVEELTDLGFTVTADEVVYTADGLTLYAGEDFNVTDDVTITFAPQTAPRLIKIKQLWQSADGSKVGLRTAAFVDLDKRDAASEYGFIVTLAQNIDTHDCSDLRFDNTELPYVYGVAYNKADGTDRVYDVRGDAKFGAENDFGFGYYYTGVITGIPETRYASAIVSRPYIVIDGVTFYGQPIIGSIAGTAAECGITLD